jgi:polysaccharide biosynthesis protein PslH
MKNILYITPYQFIPQNGGGKVAMYNQINNLSKIANVTVVGVANNKPAPALQCELIPFFTSSRFRYINPIYVFKLKKIIQTKNIDLVILEHPYMGWMLVLLQLFIKVKFVIRSQNVEYLRFKDLGKWWHPILKVYEKFIHNQANAVLCITEEDRAFFEQQKLTTKLIDFPFGTDQNSNPTDRSICRKKILEAHQLPDSTFIILYNGSLSYLPNKIGLDIILEKINPILLQQLSDYKIIICGGGLAESYNGLKQYSEANIIYTGFVDDISVYFKGADVFINPVQGGGGIKTKLIDALAYGTTAISSANGANGVVLATVAQKLIITPDYDAQAMCTKILEISQNRNQTMPTPASFYNYYNWQKVVANMLQQIQ